MLFPCNWFALFIEYLISLVHDENLKLIKSRNDAFDFEGLFKNEQVNGCEPGERIGEKGV